MSIFKQRFEQLSKHHAELIDLPNKAEALGNGIFTRWQNPVLTAEHTPLNWRYDLNPSRNPYFMERQGVNAVFNAGAMYFNDKHIVVARVEGNDRKSFFAVAESKNGIDGFQFWDNPITMPETDEPDTNVYDMRLTQHEDGYIYGLFCTERKDKTRMEDSSAAEAKCGIARTRDLITWERLPDLVSHSGQQRNVVLHPEWIDGQYGLYTRPQDGFISVGSGGGIGWGLCPDIGNAQLDREDIVDGKVYHTIKELKNGQGPTPIKTDEGWLHLAHGVRNTAAGLRYVLYMFLTDVNEPWRVTYAPAGHFMAPEGGERVGDVSNVVFCNGWIAKPDGSVLIYYASSDTRLHVATSTIEQLLDYVKNTPADGLSSAHSVKTRNALIARNLNLQD